MKERMKTQKREKGNEWIKKEVFVIRIYSSFFCGMLQPLLDRFLWLSFPRLFFSPLFAA